MDQNELLKIIEKAAKEKSTSLNLSDRGITSLPAEIEKLKNLTGLYLSDNQLKRIPAELGNLTKLTTLLLDNNQLTSIQAELAQLTNLTRLYLRSNRLTSVPSELAQLTNLTELCLTDNQLTSSPVELTQLTRLTKLSLSGNQLTSIPAELAQLTNLTMLYMNNNQLTSIPAELGKLTNLTQLWLNYNQLTSIPAELGKLTNLTDLYLDKNQLTSIPAELGKLTNLTTLDLSGNQLKTIPAELGKLTNLTGLYLRNNQLTSIPAELGQLINLTSLAVSGNQLTSIPAELGKLTNLTEFYLHNNQLTSIPSELGKLTKLDTLRLDGNKDLTSPPPEVVKQGKNAILAYLRGVKKAEAKKWEAKLLIVGEAGVGKTELVKALRGENFGGETATEGVLIHTIELKHPKESDVTMRLNLWDFGGQEIQHATHQFFYSERALFVLAWNARENYEQAKLNDWLELIQARGSVAVDEQSGKDEWKAPVLLVSTHRDLWKPDIPYEELEKQFPRIRFLGMVSVSNKTRRGIEELRKALQGAASELPLMGLRWPRDWQAVEDKLTELKATEESRMRLDRFWDLMRNCGVEPDSYELLARALDGMGKVRLFLDDADLRDVVVLDPQWLTSRIARVLKNEDQNQKAVCRHAILQRDHWGVFWPGDDEGTHELFVKMMRNFDLVYGLEDSPGHWLVVQLLPYRLSKTDGEEFRSLWSKFEGQAEITMKFRLEQSIPPGIPTWFVAREHRFSLELHWRLGVLLADNPEEPQHLGLVQSFPEQRYVQLSVRGPMPHNFFVLLRDGLEYTLARFPGLKVKRTMPCPGHEGVECQHEFELRQLEKAVEKEKPALDIQCPETLKCVSIPGLLFGLHWSTEGQVIKRMEELVGEVLAGQKVMQTKLSELATLSQRYFVALFHAQQRLAESHCPNVFAVLPKEGHSWLKNLLGQKMVIQLFCQAPGEWHPVVKGAKGGRYEIRTPAEFFESMGPYILRLAKVIKYAAPVAGAAAGVVAAGPGGAVMGAAAAKKLAAQIKLMEELAKKLVDRDYLAADLLERTGVGGKAERIEGMELRALRTLLDKEDPKHEWGGLQKVLTPEGHYLWLCDHHAAEYRK